MRHFKNLLRHIVGTQSNYLLSGKFLVVGSRDHQFNPSLKNEPITLPPFLWKAICELTNFDMRLTLDLG